MPRGYIRQLRKEAKAKREIEEQLAAEERELEEKKKRLLAERLGLGHSQQPKAPEPQKGLSEQVEQGKLQTKKVEEEEEGGGGRGRGGQEEQGGESEPLLEKTKGEQVKMENEKVRWKTTQVIVQAGATKQVPLEVVPGNYVEWGFKTEGGDIGFAVYLEKSDGDVLTIVDDEKVDSHEVSIQGSVVVEEGGRLWLQWDNTYSWLTNKELTYSISKSDTRDSPKPENNESNEALAGVPRFDLPPSVLFVLGAPGSGKGTQCALLADEFGFLHLSAGDLLRAERDNPDSKAGALIDAYIKNGKIVPIEITVKLLLNAMKADPRKCYLIDGFPRNQDNLYGWIRETGDNVKVEGVLFFDCPEDVTVQRILERGQSSGRTDDNPESIKKRLETYKNDTLPIVDHFVQKGLVQMIDTNRPVDVIFHDLQALVSRLFPDLASGAAAPVDQANQPNKSSPETATSTEQNGAAESANAPVPNSTPPPPPPPPTTTTTTTTPSTIASTSTFKTSIAASKKAPRIILGTMTMNGQTDASASERMLDLFLESKCVRNHLTAGRFEIDTARMYQHGKTEELLGSILAKRADLKESLFVATKANPFKGYGDTLRPESVEAQLMESLDDMGMDSVDVFYLHAPDHSTNIEATLEACQSLYEQGRFRELGLSNYSAWQTVQIYYMCKERGWIAPTIYQGMYNAITRDVERELLPALKALGIRFYAYNPLAGGFLSGKHHSIVQVPSKGRFGQHEWGIKYRDRFWKPSYFEALDLVKAACDRDGITVTQASIRWLLHHSRLQGGLQDGIILGASKVEHLEENLAACSQGPLSKEVVDAFENAWEITRPSCPCYFR